jgi:hypothetical protein
LEARKPIKGRADSRKPLLSSRLFHVDLFIKNAIVEGIMDIKLINLLITQNHNGEE